MNKEERLSYEKKTIENRDKIRTEFEIEIHFSQLTEIDDSGDRESTYKDNERISDGSD